MRKVRGQIQVFPVTPAMHPSCTFQRKGLARGLDTVQFWLCNFHQLYYFCTVQPTLSCQGSDKGPECLQQYLSELVKKTQANFGPNASAKLQCIYFAKIYIFSGSVLVHAFYQMLIHRQHSTLMHIISLDRIYLLL